IFTRSLRFLRKGRNTHQTFDGQSRKHEKRFQLGLQCCGFKSKFASFPCNIHFQQNARMQSILLRDAVNRLREIETINAMNHFKQRESMTNLVLLKMTDEMPAKV